MTMTEREQSLFRRQAVEFHRAAGMRGDVLHLTPEVLGVVQWLLYAVAAAGVIFVCTANVRKYASGPAVIMLDQRQELSVERAGIVAEVNTHVGQHVQAGDVLLRLRSDSERSALASIERELDDQLVLLLRAPDKQRGSHNALVELRGRRTLAQTAIERSVLRAPQDADVVDLRAHVGQSIQPGNTLVALQGEPRAAQVTALLPGADRPRIKPGMPLRLRIAGFERTSLALSVDHVDEQVLGPAEALRAIGNELADSIKVSGPVVLVHARLPTANVRAQSVVYRLHHGMAAQAEIAVEREPLLFAWLPGLREALGDVL
jgi:multidrug resistance efflux pump